MAEEGRLPSYACFPSLRERAGWPVGITGPSEGSLDRADWNGLVEILTGHSPQGAETRCLAYYTPLSQGAEDFDNLHVRSGRLEDAKALYDHPEEEWRTPSNFWAQDRSWVLCTDYDLCATKLAGPASLVEALLNDSELEAIRLPWTHWLDRPTQKEPGCGQRTNTCRRRGLCPSRERTSGGPVSTEHSTAHVPEAQMGRPGSPS